MSLFVAFLSELKIMTLREKVRNNLIHRNDVGLQVTCYISTWFNKTGPRKLFTVCYEQYNILSCNREQLYFLQYVILTHLLSLYSFSSLNKHLNNDKSTVLVYKETHNYLLVCNSSSYYSDETLNTH